MFCSHAHSRRSHAVEGAASGTDPLGDNWEATSVYWGGAPGFLAGSTAFNPTMTSNGDYATSFSLASRKGVSGTIGLPRP